MAWLCQGTAQASAQASAQTQQDVIVTATRLAGGLDPRNGNVEVIGPEQIAARQAGSIVDLIGDLPGVFVQQAGGRGSVASVFTRGAKPNFTLILIDGVRVNDPTNSRGGSYDFSGLDLNDIERIEMVRGPASAIYGSDAVGGVINIITRRGAQAPEADAALEAGSYGYKRIEARAGGPLGGATGVLGAAYDDNGTPVAGSSARTSSLDGSLQLPAVAGVNIDLNARYGSTRATTFPDSSGGPLLATLRTLDQRHIDEGLFGLQASRTMTPYWSATLEYGLFDRHGSTLSPGVAPSAQTPSGIPASLDQADFLRNQLTLTNRLTLSPDFEMAAGLGFLDERGNDAGYLEYGPARIPTSFTLDRPTGSAFAEARYTVLPNGHVSLSGRFDRTTAGVRHFSPQAGADYSVPDWGTRFDVEWGRAYKLPSFYALGNPIVGNSELKSEDATNVEAGVSQSLGRFGVAKLDVFDTHYRDLIDFQPGAVPRLVNLSAARSRGVEASLTLGWSTFSVRPHLSYVDARNTGTGAPLRDVPSWLAGGSLSWRPDAATSLNLDLSEVGPMIDNAVPSGDVRLGNHFQTDLALSRRLSSSLAVHLAVDNLFNNRSQQVVGFPSPGTVVRAGISLSL